MRFRLVLRSHVVCPSVCDVGDLSSHRWKSWKLIAQTISPKPSLIRSLQPKGDLPIPRETWGNFGETRGGVGKMWHAGEQKQQYL